MGLSLHGSLLSVVVGVEGLQPLGTTSCYLASQISASGTCMAAKAISATVAIVLIRLLNNSLVP
ncbi:hypothetical protein D3C80_2123280 [compost metagenome]